MIATRIGAALVLVVALATGVAAGALSPPIVQKGKLRASDGAMSDQLGTSIAISGNTMVVGAPSSSPKTGAAYVFKRPFGGWANATQTAKLTPSSGNARGFGSSVAISGGTIVVGAPSATDVVRAYVFEKPASGWTNATEDAKLTPSDQNVFDFGRSVSVSGNSVLVGSEQSTVNAHAAQGAAYVYVRPPGGWADANEAAKLVTATGAANDFFGFSVAIEGDTAAIGAPGRNVAGNTPDAGAIYMFVAPSGPDSWQDTNSPTGTLVTGGHRTGDLLGISLALSGATLVAGANHVKVGVNDDQGSGYVFERSAAGWSDSLNGGIESEQLVASDGAGQDKLGTSAAIFGDTVVLGAPDADVGTTGNQGAVYLFEKPATGWAGNLAPQVESAKLVAADGFADDRFGQAVTLSGNTIGVGAPKDDFGSKAERGSAYAFGQPKGSSSITLGIEKTDSRVRARGRVTPSRPGKRVIVTLYRNRGGVFRELAEKRPQEGDTGRYRTSFARPVPGRCRIVSRYRGDARTEPSRTSRRFSC